MELQDMHSNASINSDDPYEIVRYFISNLDSMDTSDVENSNLVSDFYSYCIDFDTLSLIKLATYLDREESLLEDNINTLKLEITSRKWKVNTVDEVKKIATKSGREVSDVSCELYNQINDRNKKQSKLKSLSKKLKSIKSKIVDLIGERLKSLSKDDLVKLNNEIYGEIEIYSHTIETLARELESLKERISTEDSLRTESIITGKSIDQLISELGEEYRIKFEQIQKYSYYIKAYDGYCNMISTFYNSYGDTSQGQSTK